MFTKEKPPETIDLVGAYWQVVEELNTAYENLDLAEEDCVDEIIHEINRCEAKINRLSRELESEE